MEGGSYQEWLANWHPRPRDHCTFAPAPIAPWGCPICGGPATIGIRVGGLVNVRCETDGTWYSEAQFSFTQQDLLSTPPRPARMNPEARLWFLHAAAEVMLSAEPGAFLVIERQGHPCEYAIVDRAPGEMLGLQIGGREWSCPRCGNQPLSTFARQQLRALDFDPPGPNLNAWRQNLPDTSRELAVLLERAFFAAYRPSLDFEIVLYAGRRKDYVQLAGALS